MNHFYKIILAFSIVVTISLISCKKQDQTSTNQEKIEVKTSKMKDIDSNEYLTVIIGTQEWMASNLNTEHYSNGDPIPQVQDSVEWQSLKTGAWCYYENDKSVGKIYGKLYNYYAVSDPRGLAPKGWHISSDEDWKKLEEFLGGDDNVGGKLKFDSLWTAPNTGATNVYQFKGLPAGIRRFNSEFALKGTNGYFWTSTNQDDKNAIARLLFFSNSKSERKWYLKNFAYSVRCVKD